jgi:hypothetical protein
MLCLLRYDQGGFLLILHVQYRNQKYDYVDRQKLDDLITQKGIKLFYRPSEKKWVDVDMDPVRGTGVGPYTGIERRLSRALYIG